MYSAMNADFLLSTDKDPDLDDHGYYGRVPMVDKSARIGLTGFLICAVSKSMIRCMRNRSIDGIEERLRNDIAELAGRYPDLCDGFNFAERSDKSLEPDDSPFVIAAVLPIASSYLSIGEKRSSAEVCVGVLNGSSDSKDAAVTLCEIMHCIADYKRDRQGFLKHVRDVIPEYDEFDTICVPQLKSGRSYVIYALKAAIGGGDGVGVIKYILEKFGRNRPLAAIAVMLAKRLGKHLILPSTRQCDNRDYWHGCIPDEIQKAHIEYDNINELLERISLQQDYQRDRLERYNDVFIDLDERLTQTDYLLRIYHNHMLLGCSFDIYVLRSAANDDKYVADDEFISIYEDDFELVEGLISPYIEDWDIYDNDNELSIKDLRRSWIEAQKIIEDLENGIMTDMLWSHCKKLNPSLLDKEVAVAERELFNNEQIEETSKREMSREIQIKAIFKHKDKLIRFIRAFYWFFFEHLELKDDDGSVINISGY